ncbi:MAG: TonB family protein [Gammaproteobacteria bacterium]
MSAINTWNEPFLPWVESENDRRFKRILLVSVIIFSIIGIIVPFLPKTEIVKKDLKSVSPRIAQLVLEKKKQAPPPPPKVVEKKRKVIKKPKPQAKKDLTKKQQKAQKKAASTGLAALSNELFDLRESFDMAAFDDQPLKKSSDIGKETFDKNIISSKAAQDSGGINTRKLSRSTGGSKLASRSTTNVKSSLGTKSRTTNKGSAGSKHTRPEQEIAQVFQKNKGAIFSIYNRALRKDPSLQGKVILEITIAPNGSVVKCRILSSELNNTRLEKRLIARVKLFKFKAGNIKQITVKYPIDFLPS